MVGVVVGEGAVHVPPGNAKGGFRLAVHIAAGGIGGAVGAVAAHREHTAVFQPGQRRSRRKGQLLVAPAQALAGQVHHGLAACNVSQLPASARMGADHRTKEAARLPRLAAEPVGEKHRLIPQRTAGRSGCRAQLPHTAGDAGGHVGQSLGGLLPQQLLCRDRQAQAVFLSNGDCLPAGGGVRHRRAAGDHIQRVAQNVAEDDAEHLCRGASLREPPALDAGQTLADGVHLHDVCAAGQQLGRNVLQLLCRDERLFKQCTSAAGKQEQHRVLWLQALHQLQRLLGGGKAVGVRHRVACLAAGHTGDLPFYMIVFGHDHTAVHMPQHGNGSMCHLPCGFSGGH